MATNYKKIDNLTVNLLYYGYDSPFPARFKQLVDRKRFVDMEDLEDNAFFDAKGGLDLITDRHFVFYQSCDYYDLTVVTSFLLYSFGSYFKPQNPELEWITGYSDELFLSRLSHTDGSMLYLTPYDTQYFKLEYINKEISFEEKTSEFHFDNVLIKKDVWFNSTYVALEEYFTFTRNLKEQFPDIDLGKHLERYDLLWQHLQKFYSYLLAQGISFA